MKSTCTRCLLFVVLAMLCVQAAAQNRNSITGFVFNEARRPMSDVYVELLNDTYSTVMRAQTRGSGMYSFTGLPEGLYHVKVLRGRTEYEEQIKSVTLVPISAVAGRGAAQEQVDFYLKPRKVRPGEAGAPGVVFAQTVPPAAKLLYDQGVADLENKNDQAGFERLKRSIEAFPDYFRALDRLGTEYLARGYFEAAYLLLARAVAVNSRSITSLAGLGIAEFRLGRPDASAGRFREVVKMDRSSASGHLWLGIAEHALKRLPESLAALLEANKLSSGTNAEVHWQLARVYKDQKKYILAADELDLFLKYKPEAENASQIINVIATLRAKK
ncbi:MAG TPA: carboxypeptidase regulatory-like domain-containing protein [Pyrinomonadaceae bacterium]|nr:carboxypeptidase regulatory-like domain-containing protein [Pyrinomonadaceae bacterium]